jgi:hypothetical protein
MTIYVEVRGGLGNQMFQFANGFSVAKRNKTNLKLDVSKYNLLKMHNGFELNRIFTIKAKIASEKEIYKVFNWRTYPIINFFIRNFFKSLTNYIVEPTFHYWPNVKKLKGNIYLEGYWQSELYFKTYEEEIRRLFKFKHNLKGGNLVIAAEIKAKNSVSLHIRRGDYLLKKNTSLYPTCNLKYYLDAIEIIKSRVENPFFYIFSDDIPWAKKNFKFIRDIKFVTENRNEFSYLDMQLMSLCKHHIIANSTFSWWAAWLNKNNNKIVIAPRKWFSRDHFDTSDLLPLKWIII